MMIFFNAKGEEIIGLLAIDKKRLLEENYGLTVIRADYILFGCGGPAALYEDSVYPHSQIGSTGIALKAGAIAQNLTESQFGIGSKIYRWNLSGSYQQVLPAYFSTEKDGSDKRYFLSDFFPNGRSNASGSIFERIPVAI